MKLKWNKWVYTVCVLWYFQRSKNSWLTFQPTVIALNFWLFFKNSIEFIIDDSILKTIRSLLQGVQVKRLTGMNRLTYAPIIRTKIRTYTTQIIVGFLYDKYILFKCINLICPLIQWIYGVFSCCTFLFLLFSVICNEWVVSISK